MARTVIHLESNSEALALAGEHDAHLKILEQRLDCRLTLRGDMQNLAGEPRADEAPSPAAGSPCGPTPSSTRARGFPLRRRTASSTSR